MRRKEDIIQFLYNTGHLEAPFGVEQGDLTQDDVDKLSLSDDIVKEAVRSHQSLDANYDLFAAAIHGRECIPDGDVGPATELVLDLPRCGERDYRTKRHIAEAMNVGEAVGRGNWPRCHGVGDFHAVSVKVTNSPPSFLAPLFDKVKSRVVEAYSEVGLLIRWDAPSPVNIDFSFVNSSSGWIGLAIVGTNQGCNDRIWCRYLSTYRGGSTDDQIITQWTTLIKHELGHNCGTGHTRGGVMNPSIVNGLPVSWKGDPLHSWLVDRFGGIPVPTTPEEGREMVLAWKNGNGTFDVISKVPVNTGGDYWPS